MADQFDDSLFEDKPYDESLFEEAPEPVSAPEAALMGAQQGLTFGFADEASGAVQGGLDKLQSMINEYTGLVGKSPSQISAELGQQGFTGAVGPTTSTELYAQARDVARKKYRQAEEDQPAATFAGSLAGGFLVPGAAFGKIAKGASTVEKVLKGAQIGALSGGLAGAGVSEADVTKGEVPELAKDVLKGAEMGGALGLALPLAGAAGKGAMKGAKKISEAVSDSDLAKIFKAYKGGEDLAKEVPSNLRKLQELGGEVTSGLKEMTSGEMSNISGLVKKASQQGQKIDTQQLVSDVNELIQSLPESVSRGKLSKKLESFVAKQGIGDSDPETIFNFFKSIKKDMTPSGKDLAERGIFSNIDATFKNVLSGPVEGIEAGYSKMSDLLAQFEGITGKAPAKYMTSKDKLAIQQRLGNLMLEASPEATDKTKLLNILEGFADPTKAGKTVKGLKEVAPELAGTIEKKAPELAEKVRLGYRINPNEIKTVSAEPIKQLAAQFGGGSGVLSKISAGAGKGARAVHETVSDIQNRFVDATPEQLKQLSSKLYNSGSKVYQDISRVLEKMVDKDKRGKQALMFGLMQTPAYRRALGVKEDQEQ